MVSTVRVCHNRFNVVVRDMLRYGGDEAAGSEDLEVALNLRVEAGAVDDRPVRIGPAGGADLHLLDGERVADVSRRSPKGEDG